MRRGRRTQRTSPSYLILAVPKRAQAKWSAMGIILFTVLLLPIFVHATVYKSIDRHGNVSFSDTPKPGSKLIKLQTPQTFTPPPSSTSTTLTPPASPLAQDKAEPGIVKYQTFAITSPTPDATVRNNSGNMDIHLHLVPSLQAGHFIQLEMDGKKMGGPQATTTFLLPNVERGTHKITAQIIDAKGHVIATTPSVTFHMHQARITPIGIRSQILQGMKRAQSPHAGSNSGGGLVMMGAPPTSTKSSHSSSSSSSPSTLVSKALTAVNNAAHTHILNPNIQNIIALYKQQKFRREVAQNRAILLQGQEPNLMMQGALPNPQEIQGALPNREHYAPLMQGQTPDIQIQGSLLPTGKLL